MREQPSAPPQPVTLHPPARRGVRRFRMAMVGHPNSGKSTIFDAVASTSIHTGQLAGTEQAYKECAIRIGADEVSLVDLPALYSLRDLEGEDRESLKYLLWGDARPPVSSHDAPEPPAPFSRPDVLIHVVDASAVNRTLPLTLELAELGLPLVIGLNMMDEARRKGIRIDVARLSDELGVPVVPMTALKGHGIRDLFGAAMAAARRNVCPRPQTLGGHLRPWAKRLETLLDRANADAAFRVPGSFLIAQVLEGDAYLCEELESHLPEAADAVAALRREADAALPRPLADEVAAERHHRAASLLDRVVEVVHRSRTLTWEDRLDALFLDPRWGLVGSLAVFAGVLFLVFEGSATLDRLTAMRLAEMVAAWQPAGLWGTVGRGVVDGLIGLVGIVVPYMLPLVLMLVALEESGVMQRIAFVVDRFFHRVGLHGKVAVPFLLGLGCNVPAITATRGAAAGRDRVVASLLIAFVPCSARSAVILALGGKYLGGLGVFAIFLLSFFCIALLGRLLTWRYPEVSPGIIQEIPGYAVPRWRTVARATWGRTRDILTIVTPLLVGGSVALALLQYGGADAWINALLAPLTHWLLGLPNELGVPLLFGILRKELSLVMIYQALGTFDVDALLDWVQITTFLIFIMLYIPCISTFAAMVKVIGRREALFSIVLSVGTAVVVATLVRGALELGRLLL